MDCPHISDLGLEEFAKRLIRKATAERIPYSGTMELTSRCNLNCAHCYINLPAGDRDARSRELSKDQFKDIIDQAAEYGLLWLLFTGGEIFLREDFLQIYEYAKRKGILITLFTNGTLITPEIADFLGEWRPLRVEITLYGMTQETYEKVTQVPGSFERCRRGIELLVDRKVPLKLKTTVLTLNQHELWEMKRFAEELVGPPFRYDPMIHPRREDSSRVPVDYRLSPEEIVQLEMLDGQRVDEWREFCTDRWGPINVERRYFCGAGRSTFHVDSFGRMSPCLMSSQHRYDLLAGSFGEGWFEWMPQVVNQKPARWTECRGCDLIILCQNCPAWGEMEHGEAEIAPIDFLCRLAHFRTESFEIDDLINRKELVENV